MAQPVLQVWWASMAVHLVQLQRREGGVGPLLCFPELLYQRMPTCTYISQQQLESPGPCEQSFICSGYVRWPAATLWLHRGDMTHVSGACIGLLVLMQVWLQHTSDPLIAPDAQEVIGALASHSSCLPSLVQAAAPTLAAILQRGAARRLAKLQGQPPPAAATAAGSEGLPESPMLVEASLDLLGALVKPGHEATTMEVGRRLLSLHFCILGQRLLRLCSFDCVLATTIEVG